MSGIAYVDTSALAKLVTEEPESARLARSLAAYATLVTSRIAAVELARTCLRAGVDPLRARAVEEALVIVEIGAPIARRAAELPPPALRTLDAIHLATALALADEPLDFVTYDRRLGEAAALHGLRVVAP